MLAQQLSKPPCDSHHAGGPTQVQEKTPHGKTQHSSTSGSAMRAMHDSSSSWTDRSLPPRTQVAGAQQQADAACLQPPQAQMQRLQPVCLKPMAPDGGVMDMQAAGAACTSQAAPLAASDAAAVVTVPQNGMSFGDLAHLDSVLYLYNRICALYMYNRNCSRGSELAGPSVLQCQPQH